MPTQFSPRQLALSALEGFNRMKRYRAARMMFMKEHVGQYYKDAKGITGETPINLIFNTIKVMVPNIVMRNPKNDVITDFMDQEDYAFLLGRGIDDVERRIRFEETLRAGIVDAHFGFGLFKVGIAESGQLLTIDDIHVDPGSVYCDIVDLDNLCIDPLCRVWDKATFIGDRIRVPRQILLDKDGWDHDLVRELPRSGTTSSNSSASEYLSKQQNAGSDMMIAMDYVDVVEIWVPSANAIVTIPDPSLMVRDKYINIREYYGPKEGPYEKLALTLPVSNNALPVAPVSVWYDLHKMANRMFKKTFEQAERQKDIGVYDPANTDQAEDMREAQDGEMLPGDPNAVKVVSFGGQAQTNESMTAQLQSWYNYIAGNPDQMAGQKAGADSATEATILQGNAAIGMADTKSMVYKCAANIGSKIGWYLHYDPFIELPIIVRSTGGQPQQLWLTPEQRRGDHYNFTFRVKPKSMQVLEPNIRAQRIIQFTTNVIPAAANTQMILTQQGIKFNLPEYLRRTAEEMEIGDWVQGLWDDPEWDRRLEHIQKMGPQAQGKASTGAGPNGVLQNGQLPMAPASPMIGQQQMHSNAQMGANTMQSMLKGGA